MQSHQGISRFSFDWQPIFWNTPFWFNISLFFSSCWCHTDSLLKKWSKKPQVTQNFIFDFFIQFFYEIKKRCRNCLLKISPLKISYWNSQGCKSSGKKKSLSLQQNPFLFNSICCCLCLNLKQKIMEEWARLCC